ncbi:hypothetical protein [Flavobacterium sp.]|nr:hypothetical protein [Flavobacterium sp.]
MNTSCLQWYPFVPLFTSSVRQGSGGAKDWERIAGLAPEKAA